MNNAATLPETDATRLDALRARLADDPSGVLEILAHEYGVSMKAVIECLPETCRTLVAGAQAEAALLDIAAWGAVTVLVHTQDVILECKGPLPAGRIAHGFYNIGGGSPVSGHLRLDRCQTIAFVRRPFMGAESYSVNFLNAEGEAMFKVFVGRDEKRVLLADQVERFGALRDRLAAAGAVA
ncbi:MAG: heme utilization protein HuvX [Candidatus Dactylopiibacterium carminicum]|uniref:Heme utilization cystosolic carrier protein HutX n=1 Tax=Candidatus Dactylopiibacterium carminicum TaxID=857335 RepID=A0A272ESC9_9RHOO|nr:heme utilization cystosolic carrier protein HutX [Candidatus Dactylopiibacterium carminicum]KAF7599018.1 heme utilization cystosolic carrier protein HutX [Candidatus Dactylopiibacterium carminicum]PAS93023.1 MAG: heme utilization protein HuvX [Candidatus Dactylopiibacterium carminicum]PAS96697.1 MAG: heme utilization protein HuvX [Candidatus Dactylopiibacterium carminicum]PAS99032.1 MAG: heme utilization protein HuvX [Candidatus Dactylopiibacterium carminicum]